MMHRHPPKPVRRRRARRARELHHGSVHGRAQVSRPRSARRSGPQRRAIGAIADEEKRGRGAAIGAGVGVLAGGAVGFYMDHQEKKLRERLQGTGVSVKRVNDDIFLNMPGNLTFATDRAEIRSDFYDVLNSVVLVINEYEKTLIEITGHTDSTGTTRTTSSSRSSAHRAWRRTSRRSRWFRNASSPRGSASGSRSRATSGRGPAAEPARGASAHSALGVISARERAQRIRNGALNRRANAAAADPTSIISANDGSGSR